MKMKRIELVYEKLKELYAGQGLTASEIADSLGMSRANVSSDLNKLVAEGKAEKIKSKPVLFIPFKIEQKVETETIFDLLCKNNPSLFAAIEQAKAAVLYPPKGMNIMILGDTGVGKSMFADLIYAYAKEVKRLPVNSPFVLFNCADYANNPQLLISQLFGCKKGAYTGADEDKSGLIEKADNGILFLDEVHRLPPEGQELFFTFMDKGMFRRLGETDVERRANVLIIAATTENPESSLLRTFTRRIPMVISLPALSQRSFEERFHLIKLFMDNESARLGRPISVSVNSLKAFLSYSCPNNIGQLKSDIRLACARAYADYVSRRKEEIRINSSDLPSAITAGLFMETEHRQLWNKIVGINRRYVVFDGKSDQLLFEDAPEKQDIYDLINLRIHELKSQGLDAASLDREIEKDFNEYFQMYFHNAHRHYDTASLKYVVSPQILRLTEEIIRYSEENLNRLLGNHIYYGLATHINNVVERLRHKKKIINPQLNRIRVEHSEEFAVALDCLQIIGRVMEVSLPVDEAGYLAMFFVYSSRGVEQRNKDVKVFVAAHGQSTATSMAETANALLGAPVAIGFNVPLDERPQAVIARITTYINESKNIANVLLLVDMGSLTAFGEELEKTCRIKTKTLPLVSTLHVLEAARKAMLGYSLEEVYREVLDVYLLIDDELQSARLAEIDARKLAIVTVCTTGEGTARVLQTVLERNLHFNQEMLDIIPVNLVGEEDIYTRLHRLANKYQLVAAVTPFPLRVQVPQFDLEEVLRKKGIEKLQLLIDEETTYNTLGETLAHQLQHVDGFQVLDEIKAFNQMMSEQLGVKVPTNALIGLTLHLACMIDRLSAGATGEPFENKDRFMTEHAAMAQMVRRAVSLLERKYRVIVSDDEVCYIVNFFNHVKVNRLESN